MTSRSFSRTGLALLVLVSIAPISACGVERFAPHKPSPSSNASNSSHYPSAEASEDIQGELPTYQSPNGETIKPADPETVLDFGETENIVQLGNKGTQLFWAVTVDQPKYQQRDLEMLDDPRDSNGLQSIVCFPVTLEFLGSDPAKSDIDLPRPQLSAARTDGFDGYEILGLPDDVCNVDMEQRLPNTESALNVGATYSAAVAGLKKSSDEGTSESGGNPLGVRFDYPVSLPGVSSQEQLPSSIYWGPFSL